VDSFRAKIRSLLRLCDSLWKGAAPDFLNIGGGFAGKMPRTLSAQFDYRIPTYRQYAASVAKTVAEHYGSSRQGRPRLFIEPGTGIVANCMSFVTRITATKNVRKTRIAVCSGSVFNTSPTAKSIALPIRIVGRSARARSRTRTDIVGYTCIEADYLARGVRGSLQQGDFAVIDNVGSYSIVMKPPFILPNAPVILLRRGGRDFQILKRAEKPSDVFQTFCDFKRIGRSNP
jgi:diaminopimelate decarboxylase